MEQLRQDICATGRRLLGEGLVARTWGNVSARIDGREFFITPSGLDYTKTAPEDIVRFDRETKQWQGLHKPSSEKGIHAAAYELFPEVGFVIHTHQTCASAIGLAGFDALDAGAGELERLGGIARASYGLPGTGKLKNAVRAAMEAGARTVLMVSHGALVCGRDMDDAMDKARLLEEICRRNLKLPDAPPRRADRAEADGLLKAVKEQHPFADIASTDALVTWADKKTPLRAQLDDMAQMLGAAVDWAPCDAAAVEAALKKRDAVLVPGIGAVASAGTADDTQALKILLDKAAVCALHTQALGVNTRLSGFDTALMRLVYMKKYSKQKG